MKFASRYIVLLTGAAFAGTNCSDRDTGVGPSPLVATVTMSGTPNDGVLVVGESLSLLAASMDASGKTLLDRTVAWSSSNSTVASVSTDGVVTGASAGRATIRATAGAAFDTTTLDVRVAVVPPPASATASLVQTVLDGRVTLSIPPGAVPTNVPRLTVGPSATAPANTELVAGTAFDFGPAGTQFSTPLTLTIRFEAGSAGTAERAGLAIYHVVGAGYHEVLGSVVDPTSNEVSAPVSSFSSYAVLRRAPPASAIAAAGDRQSVSAGEVAPVRPAIRVFDVYGLPASFARVTFAVASGSGHVNDSVQTTDRDGIATVGSWSLGPVAGANTLTATASGVAPVTFTATGISGPTARLVITTQPMSATAGATLSVVAAAAHDANGNPATSFDGPVSIGLAANPGNATLGGSTTVSAVGGVATFVNLSVNRTGVGYTLIASNPNLTSATTTSFGIAPGAAHQLAFVAYPADSSIAGSSTDPVTVVAHDASGNIATNFAGQVTVTLAQSPSGASVRTTSTTAMAGTATLDIGPIIEAGEFRLAANGSGLASASGAPFRVFAGPAAALALAEGGGQTAMSGTTLPFPVVVQLTDAFGNPVGQAGRTVQFVPGSGGSVAPASAVTDGSGRAGTVWTLGATAGTQSLSATGTALGTVNPTATAVGPFSLSIVSGANQSAVRGAPLQPIVVKLSDAAGNGVAGRAVTFGAAIGSGSWSPTSAISNAQGLVSLSWTLGPSLGLQTVVASAPFTPSSLTIGATATTPPKVLHLYSYDYYSAFPGEYWKSSLGVGQVQEVYVRTEDTDPVGAPLTVTLSHNGSARTSAPSTVTIAAGNTVVFFTITGASAGTDELVASAPGYTSSVVTTVIDRGSIVLEFFSPNGVRVQDSVQVTLVAMVPTGQFASAVASPTTFAITTNANIQSVSGGAPSTPIGSVTVPAGGVYAVFWVKAVAVGTATITATNADYSSGSTTITVVPR